LPSRVLTARRSWSHCPSSVCNLSVAH